MTPIRIKLDVRSGIIEVDAEAENFVLAMDRAESLLDKFASIGAVTDKNDMPLSFEPVVDEDNQTDTQDPPAPKVKRKKSSTGTKVTSWKVINDLLTEEKRAALREFFENKHPSSQNEMVAVLSCKLKDLTGRDGFDGNEIYTAFQIVGKKTPGNLRAVFGNMTTAGLGSVLDHKFRPNFKADDLVKHDLPPKVGKK